VVRGTDLVDSGNGVVGKQVPPSKVGRQPSIQKLLRMYRSNADDLSWARNGCTASVINGEVISVVQNRIVDADFEDLEVIPMGADRVFLYSSTGVDVSLILEGARDFFAHFFSNIRRWDKEVVSFQRGAWLRLYGILLHAWNETFFKLCVIDCGRFLRTDSCSTDKARFDFARVLIATSSLEVVNCVEKLVIDGQTIEIKIVEEWGFNLGEDVCLLEPDDGTHSSHSDHDVFRGEVEHNGVNTDFLVDKIVDELAAANKEEPLVHVFNDNVNGEDEVENKGHPIFSDGDIHIGPKQHALVDKIVENNEESQVHVIVDNVNGEALVDNNGQHIFSHGDISIGPKQHALVDKIVEINEASQVHVMDVNINGEDVVDNNGQPFIPDGEIAPKPMPIGMKQHAASDICMEAEDCIPLRHSHVVAPTCETGVDIVDNGVQPLFIDDVTAPKQAPNISSAPKQHFVSEVSIEAANSCPFDDPPIVAPIDSVGSGIRENRRRVRTSSCPPWTARSFVSGPWSLEWINDIHHGEAGVIASSRKKVKKVLRPMGSVNQAVNIVKKRKKVDGVLRHSVHSLKKVARLPGKDRSSVLKILKKKVRQRQGSDRLKKSVNVVSQNISDGSSSSGSVNNDWSHWVVMHGNEKVAMEDVWGIGKAIGIQFNGETHNMFGVLARKGRGMGVKRSSEVGEGGSATGGAC
jgi:hypothetical protein